MTRTLLATTVIPFFFATAAVAQTGDVMGDTWNDNTVGAFFTDDGSMDLLDDAEIRTNWAALSAEEQATVMASCASMETAATPDMGGTETGTTNSNASTFGEATTGMNNDGAPAADSTVTTGTAPDAGEPDNSNSSTFGSATTGNDETPDTVPGTVESGSTSAGTGQTNASTFGDPATGMGVAAVSSETWEELCTNVAAY